jgi:hypothetical protein
VGEKISQQKAHMHILNYQTMIISLLLKQKSDWRMDPEEEVSGYLTLYVQVNILSGVIPVT